MATSEAELLVVGYNLDGDFGLGHEQPVTELTPLTNPSITKAIACLDYFIFSDDNYNKLWSAGNNPSGRLGIGKVDTNNRVTKYSNLVFEENKIKIKKTVVIQLEVAHFISHQGKLYRSGNNYAQQKGLNTASKSLCQPKLISSLTNKVIDVQSSGSYSVALCGSDIDLKYISLIISNWCRVHDIQKI